MWTLENIVAETSTVKSLADWGLDDLKISRVNLDAHVVTLLANGRAFDAAEIFPRGSTVVIRRDDVFQFYGRVDRWSRSGSGRGESQAASIINPWWHLAKKTFTQNYRSFVSSSSGPEGPVVVYETKSTARVFLNLEVNEFFVPTGELKSIRDQVIEILQCAIDAGAPIAIGTVDGADVFPETEEVKMITCAEALMKQWRWARDMVLWWDYTTAPFPTVHFRKADNLAAVDVDLSTGTLLESFTLEELEKVPAVVINYEASNGGYLAITKDQWPETLPEDKFGWLEIVLDVRGTVVNQSSVTLKTEAVAVADAEWWKRKLKWLADPNITGITFVDQNGTAAAPTLLPGVDGETLNPNLTRELLPDGGSLPDWIAGKTGQSVVAKGWVTLTQKNASKPTKVPIHYEMVTTNATSGDFNNTEIAEVGDPIPTDLARRVWESHQKLGANGSLTNVETELTGGVSVGNVVNFITPARPEWAGLRAIVQAVEETVVEGRTTVRFGTLMPLGYNDLADILRMARARQKTNSVHMRSGAARPAVSLGKKTPHKNSQSGLPAYEENNVTIAELHAGSATPTGKTLAVITTANPGDRFATLPDNAPSAANPVANNPTHFTGRLTSNGKADPTAGSSLSSHSHFFGKHFRVRWFTVCNPDTGERGVLGIEGATEILRTLPEGAVLDKWE